MSVATATVAEAFDRVAAAYDATFGANPAGLLFRHVVQERLLRLLPAGAHVLDIGCGTGEDALLLAGRGRHVHAIDVSPEMVRASLAKARRLGLAAPRLVVERRSAEELAAIGARFDGAYSDFGALNCADLAAVGRGLCAVLRPGAPVLLSVMGGRPLPARVRRALTGERGHHPPRVGGLPVDVDHPGLRRLRAALGPGFEWRRSYALGVLVPGPQHPAWPGRHPIAFGVLAAMESLVRGWPFLRGLGDHLVLEGRRR